MDPILQIIIIIITFIAGIFANKYYQKLQSEEVLKQHLHKEKLQLYIKLTRALSEAATRINKSESLDDHILGISNLQLHNSLLMSNNVIRMLTDFLRDLIEFQKTGIEFQVARAVTKIVSEMRKELHIRELSIGLEKLLSSSR